MTAVGSLIRTLRSARALSLEDAAGAAGIPISRLRRIERGTTELEYLEGIRLAKGLDLCPTCFRKLFEAAADRDAYAAAMADDAASAQAPE